LSFDKSLYICILRHCQMESCFANDKEDDKRTNNQEEEEEEEEEK